MVRTLVFSIFLVALGGCSSQTSSKTAETPATAPPAATSAPAVQPASASAPVTQPSPVPAPTTALATQDTNVQGIAADFTECKRKEGVLSVKIRYRNVSPAEARIGLIGSRNYDAYYVTAANKKYFMLKDSEGVYLTPRADGFGSLDVTLKPNEQYTWWAKFPAPPADIKKITFMTPLAPPFEDIPVADQ